MKDQAPAYEYLTNADKRGGSLLSSQIPHLHSSMSKALELMEEEESVPVLHAQRGHRKKALSLSQVQEEGGNTRSNVGVVESKPDLLWMEVSGNTRRQFRLSSAVGLEGALLRDERQLLQKGIDSFMSRFFPLGYPHSTSEGYLTYSKYRAIQHFASAALHVLSTQSLLFAAGLRPTPAQATIVSWVLKDGMQHVGKLFCSSMGARMDAEPKRWRLFADVMYDLGAGLEVALPLCPQHFLGVAGLANCAKGMALVSARSTRLPIYASFAREGNLSDLYAKGEAISTLSNVLGIAVGIRLAATIAASTRGKLLVAPILSAVHLYAVSQEMRAAPVNTLNAQRTAFVISDFMQTGQVPRPASLRHREHIVFPAPVNNVAGAVRVGAPLRTAVPSPSEAAALHHQCPGERFLLKPRLESRKGTRQLSFDLILHHKATGEDAVRGWLLAACMRDIASGRDDTPNAVSASWRDAHEKMEDLFPRLRSGLLQQGWHTDLFLESSGCRAWW